MHADALNAWYMVQRGACEIKVSNSRWLRHECISLSLSIPPLRHVNMPRDATKRACDLCHRRKLKVSLSFLSHMYSYPVQRSRTMRQMQSDQAFLLVSQSHPTQRSGSSQRSSGRAGRGSDIIRASTFAARMARPPPYSRL